MASYELVFDMGSSYISAGLKKDGFSDKIPSVVAYGGQDSNQIVAVGVEALHFRIERRRSKAQPTHSRRRNNRRRRREGACFHFVRTLD